MTKADKDILRYLNDDKVIEIFYSKCRWTSSGCLEFVGHNYTNGYGRFSPYSNTSMCPHRFSFALNNFKIVPLIRHKCDNRICVNPLHLIEGTQKDNVRDCINRGRRRGRADFKQCIRGHEYTEGSYWIDKKGFKLCKICNQISKKKFNVRTKA